MPVPRTGKGAPGLESQDVSGIYGVKGIRQISPVSLVERVPIVE